MLWVNSICILFLEHIGLQLIQVAQRSVLLLLVSFIFNQEEDPRTVPSMCNGC